MNGRVRKGNSKRLTVIYSVEQLTEERFPVQEYHYLGYAAISPIISNCHLEGSRVPQRTSLPATMWKAPCHRLAISTHLPKIGCLGIQLTMTYSLCGHVQNMS